MGSSPGSATVALLAHINPGITVNPSNQLQETIKPSSRKVETTALQGSIHPGTTASESVAQIERRFPGRMVVSVLLAGESLVVIV